MTTVFSDLGLATDERFSEPKRRRANDGELSAMIEEALKTRCGKEWFRVLDDAGVPCEIANPSFGREIFLDLVMRDLGLIVEHQHPKLGRFEQFGTTIDFSVTPGVVQGPPPVIGQHTREILREHGFEADKIEELLASKAIYEDLGWTELPDGA